MIGLDNEKLTGIKPKITREKAKHTLSDIRMPGDPGYKDPAKKRGRPKKNAESDKTKQEQ